MAFGSELRRKRRAAGFSLSELAARVHYSEGYLNKVEAGAARPNATLAQLCDIALGAAGALVSLVSADARRVAVPRLRTGLPPLASHFRDRAEEFEGIHAVLTGADAEGPVICAVNGIPGVGKTALALRCAHRIQSRFTDGCLFIDLRSHRPGSRRVEPAEVFDRFLRLLGVPVDEIPPDPDDRARAFRRRLHGRNVLMVLDDAATTAQVLPIIPAEPRCRVLVTSRHELTALADAHHIPLRELARFDAAGFFGPLNTHGRPEPAAAAVDRIVDHCGRLPLALRIAAGRLHGDPPGGLDELDSRLADEFARLAALEEGERGVAAAFHLAYRRLSPEHQNLFGLLARYPGADFDLVVVAALAGTGFRAAEVALRELAEANLIDAGSRGRYRIHDLLKAIVRDNPQTRTEQKSMSRLLDVVVARLLAVDEFLAPQRYRPRITGLDAVRPEFGFAGQEAALQWVAGEAEALEALVGVAADRGFHDRCWQLAFLLRTFYFLDKRWDSWIGTHRVAIGAAKASGDSWAEAVTHNNLGVALLDRGDREQAAEHFRLALDLFGDLADEHGLTTTRGHLAWVSHYHGHHHTALNELTAALAFYRRHGAQRNEAITLRGIALVETALGRCSDAANHAEEAIELFEELGLDLDAAMAVNVLAWAHYRRGRSAEAAQCYAEAGSRARRCGSDYEAARAATGLGNVHAAAGRLFQAEQEWRRADGYHSRLLSSDVGEARVRDELRNTPG